MFNRHNTAITRSKPSAPVAWAIEQDIIKGKVFDWGCGRGFDVNHLNSLGFETVGFDPHYAPENYPKSKFTGKNTIFCNYVLNVIDSADERKVLLETIRSKMNKKCIFILSVRDNSVTKEAEAKGWKKYRDGYISSESRKTFQKGFSAPEIKKIAESVGFKVLNTNSNSGGVFLVLSL